MDGRVFCLKLRHAEIVSTAAMFVFALISAGLSGSH